MSRLWTMDSLSIRLPLHQIQIIDPDLKAMYHTYSDATGEEKSVVRNNKIEKWDRGIKTKFSIQIQFNKDRQKEEHLVVILTSKMLKSRYFEGIHSGSIQAVYDYLMEQQAVSFSLQTFLTSQAVDIDWKSDFTCNKLTVKQSLKVMQKQYITTPKKNSHCTPHGLTAKGSETNIGLQFNDRETTSIHTSPYMKIYFKTGELLTKSNVFALEHLQELPEDLFRIEFTLKNKEHLKLNDMKNTLGELLQTSQETVNKAYLKTLSTLLSKRLREAVKNDQIPPKDLLYVNFIINSLDKGDTWSMLKKNVLGSLTGSNRTKKTELLDRLYNSYVAPIKKYSNHKNIDSLLEQIGYTF